MRMMITAMIAIPPIATKTMMRTLDIPLSAEGVPVSVGSAVGAVSTGAAAPVSAGASVVGAAVGAAFAGPYF